LLVLAIETLFPAKAYTHFERFTFKAGELARLRGLGGACRSFWIWLQVVIFQYLTPNDKNSFPANFHLAPGLLLTTFEKQTVNH
jgi:hypothetical protein